MVPNKTYTVVTEIDGNSSITSNRQRGMTLVEITLVIAVMLGLISVLLIGFDAYKAGANRANCIQNVVVVQKAVRSYSNLSEVAPGDIVSDFKDRLIGPGKMIEAVIPCPAGGHYTFNSTNSSGDTVPTIGDLYLNCSLGDHTPKNSTSW
jgi:type II secretory pathway pseudopilin PulG